LFTLLENKRFSLRAGRNQSGNRIIHPHDTDVPAEFAGFSVIGQGSFAMQDAKANAFCGNRRGGCGKLVLFYHKFAG
jgi:hypothetical protein